MSDSDKDKPERYPTPGLVGFDPTGVTWRDLDVLDNPSYPQAERVAAAEWVAECWYGRPIAPQRWQAIGDAVRRELEARAKANGTTREKELNRCVANSLLLAVDQAGGIFTPGPRRAFHTKLNNLVTEDLLGPGWRERAHEDIAELENFLVDQFEHALLVETVVELDALMSKAKLSKRETEMFMAVLQDERPGEAAARLDITEGAARTVLSRARKKLRDAKKLADTM